MAFWNKKEKVTPVAPVAQRVEIPRPPADFVPVTRPEGATEEELLDGYKGRLYKVNGNCGTCFGNGFMRKAGGNVTYCTCVRAEMQMLTKNDHVQSTP